MSSLSNLKTTVAERLKAKDYTGANAAVEGGLAIAPDDADLLQLQGLALKHLGRLEDAAAAMQRSLRLAPDQAHVHNNLGGVRLRLGDWQAAKADFEAAIRLKPNYKDAWRNLALALRRLGDLDAAEQALESALSIDADFLPALGDLGELKRDRGELDASVTLLQRACAHPRAGVDDAMRLAATLRAASRYDEAATVLRPLTRLAPRSPVVHAMLGATLFDLDDAAGAEAALSTAVALKPDYEEAHFALNQVLWSAGADERFLVSYDEAAERASRPVDIRCAQAQTLMFLDRHDEAVAVLEAALAREPRHVRARHMMGRALAHAGRADRAIGYHEALLREAPDQVEYRIALARSLIHHGDHAAALEQLSACDPAQAWRLELEQQIVALRFVAAHHLRSAEAERLYDYDRFVRVFELPKPPGFASLDAFNAALSETLLARHQTVREPIEQTLRGGTQTSGRLFNETDPVIVALREALRQAVDRYIAELPALGEHPFEARRPKVCRFAGSWSVRLKGGGFHKNHIHSRGWLSSAYYVALPPEMRDAEAAKAGWLKFGQPHDLPGCDEEPGSWVRPQAGLLAVFPSYMWHGTEAFASDEHPRLTVAFDVQTNAPTPDQLRHS